MKTTEWNNWLIQFSESMYEPREDSFLLANHLPNCTGKQFVDMGCGSGIQSLMALQKGAASVTLVDRNPEALVVAKENIVQAFPHAIVHTFESFLFEKVPTGFFDVIAFNPPYLPSEETDDIRVDGGKKGREVLDQFLNALPNRLAPNGMAAILHSSFNEDEVTKQKIKELNLNSKVVVQERFFFEELSVWHIWKN